MLTALRNSALLTVASVTLIVLVSAFVAYVMQRRNDRVAAFVGAAMFSGLVLPPAIVPTVFWMQKIGLYKTLLSLIFIEVALSMPFAIFAFLRHPQSFEETLFTAILHGGDRDTLGAMACAISGAYLGIEAIPASWRRKLENRPYIEELASKLFILLEGASSTGQPS